MLQTIIQQLIRVISIENLSSVFRDNLIFADLIQD